MSTKLVVRFLAVSAFVSLALFSAAQFSAAQQAPPMTNADSSAQSQTQSSSQNSNKEEQKPPSGSQEKNVPSSTSQEGSVQGTSNDRLFYTLPNFLTLENAGHVPPLTTREKFAVVTRSSFDYVIYPWAAFLAGVSQAGDSEPGYGQGAAGYGKRFGAAFADITIENYMTGAVLPSLLHQDPRYFQSGKGGFWHRTWYSMSRNLLTRTDSGGEQFNYSEVVGGALSAAISTYAYHPKSRLVTTPSPGVLRFIPSDRTLPNTAKVWGTQYGYDTLTLVVREFWPDIRRKLSHKSRSDQSGADSPAP